MRRWYLMRLESRFMVTYKDFLSASSTQQLARPVSSYSTIYIDLRYRWDHRTRKSKLSMLEEHAGATKYIGNPHPGCYVTPRQRRQASQVVSVVITTSPLSSGNWIVSFELSTDSCEPTTGKPWEPSSEEPHEPEFEVAFVEPVGSGQPNLASMSSRHDS